MPWRWNHSTAGFSASARKSAIRIQVRTWRAIQTTSSRIATAIVSPSTARIVVARKRMTRSSTSAQHRAQRRTAQRLHHPLLSPEAAVFLNRAVQSLNQTGVAHRQATRAVGELVPTLLLAVSWSTCSPWTFEGNHLGVGGDPARTALSLSDVPGDRQKGCRSLAPSDLELRSTIGETEERTRPSLDRSW